MADHRIAEMKVAFAAILFIVALGACKAPATSPPVPTPSEVLSPTSTSTAVPELPPSPLTSVPEAARSADYRFLQKPSVDTVRVMTYNVNWDSIFPDGDPMNHSLRDFNRVDAFVRVMRAIQPDVVCLQEINYLRGRQALGEFMAEAMGAADDEEWQVAIERDNVIATHFALNEKGYELATGSVRPDLLQAAALVDLPDGQFGDTDLYMICSHFKAAGTLGDILLRSRQADAIMNSVRDFTTPGGEIDLEPGTPYVLLGDFNVYDTDPHLHLRTLVRGDIDDESRFGTDLDPDWDGTALADLVPSHNGQGDEFYTWRNDGEPFNPGLLDRIIYSDSVLEAANAFVLNTMLLSDEALESLGLQMDDVLLDARSGYYDHLPLVVDFVISKTP